MLIKTLLELADELSNKNVIPLLVGCGDWYARIVSMHKDELKEHYLIPYVDFELLDFATQKENFYSLCDELGIAYPKTKIFSCKDQSTALDVSDFSFPVIAKPSNSAAWHYAEIEGKEKVFEFDSFEQLETIYKRACASSYDRELIVQEFIPGPDENIYWLQTYTDEASEIRLSCMGQVVLQDHAPTTIGNPVVIRNQRIEEVVSAAQKILKRLNYHGYANFDIKYDVRDGSYRFFEINTRPGRSSYAVSLSGTSLVDPLIDDLVYGELKESYDCSKDFLFACVPAYVVKRSVQDEQLKREVLSAYKSGLAQNPQFYAPDSLKQKIWASFTYYNSIRKFKRYLWDA